MSRGNPADATLDEFERWVEAMKAKGYRPEQILGITRSGLTQMIQGRTRLMASTWLHCQHFAALLTARKRIHVLEDALRQAGRKPPPAPVIEIAGFGQGPEFEGTPLEEARHLQKKVASRPDKDRAAHYLSGAVNNLSRAEDLDHADPPGAWKAHYATGLRLLRLAKKTLAAEEQPAAS
jgi:hypothetical protein